MTLSSSILACESPSISHPLIPSSFSQSQTPPLPRRATHLSRRLFWLLPKSSKTPGTENPSTSGSQVTYTHARKRIRLIITYALLCGYPPFRADNTTTLAQQSADSKIEFQSPYRKPVSEQAKSFIRRLATVDLLHRPTAQEALHDPWLTPIPIGTDTPSHVDLSTTLRQNWSPRAKWHSALTGIRAANRFSYFAAAAAASRTSTQSSGGWDDVVDPNSPVTQLLEKEKEEKEEWSR